MSLFKCLLLLVSAFIFVNANNDIDYPNFSESGCLKLPTLICVVGPTEGYAVSGIVTFTPVWEWKDEGDEAQGKWCFTQIDANLTNLTPSHFHGFHIHTYGDISAPDGTSTGGHFSNPAGEDLPHGYPNDQLRHWGDLGNLTTDASGAASYSTVDRVIRLGGIVGRAITIHADEDKGAEEQPSGKAGARVAYGVIGYAKPAEE